jgi:hypothetical protein
MARRLLSMLTCRDAYPLANRALVMAPGRKHAA